MREEEKEIRKLEDVLKDENIIDFNKLHENVDYVFSKISNSISKTLGPGGGFTLISHMENSSPVYATKDGYTLIQEFKFNDQVNFFIAEIIKDISRRMNVNVGDSTTSGIIIAYALYSKLIKYDITKEHEQIGCSLPPISIRTILEAIRCYLTENLMSNDKYILKNIDRELENKYIEKVATISANNDVEIGKLVSDLFISRDTNHVFVTTEVGTADETIIEKEVGFEFGSGFINPIMANQTDRITCKFKNPKFFLVDGPITLGDLPILNNIIDYVIEDLKQPIILVAKDYDQPTLNMLIDRCTETVKIHPQTRQPYKHDKQPIAALTINADYEKSRDRLEDLRILLGCEIVETKKGKIMEFKSNTDFINKFLGEAEEFSGTQLRTRVKRGRGDKKVIMERIKHIEDRIKEVDLNEGILAFSTTDNMRRRIAMMNSDMSIIRVGGANDKERRAKKLIFDDAVLACSSAVESGISLGGNINIPHFIEKNFNEIVEDITLNLIHQSKHIVVGNRFEDVSLIVKDILDYVSSSFKAAYTTAIENMVGKNTNSFNNIINNVYGEENIEKDLPRIFNLVSGEYVTINDENTIPVPAKTDFELMSSVFGVVGTLISSNQFLSILPGKSTVYGKK